MIKIGGSNICCDFCFLSSVIRLLTPESAYGGTPETTDIKAFVAFFGT
jgi:hypothetical protein